MCRKPSARGRLRANVLIVKLIRGLMVFVALVVIPAPGWLLAATIFTYFADKIEVGDVGTAPWRVVAKTCERQGPVTFTGGFGYWWKCSAEATPQTGLMEKRTPRMVTTRGWLKPEHIGTPVSANKISKGGGIGPDKRPYLGTGGFMAMAFGVVWLLGWAEVARRVLRFAERVRRPSAMGG